MRNKQQLITYSYHFINEAMIIFLLLLPILYLEFNFTPYWQYLLIIVCLNFLYLVYVRYTKSYAFYIVTAPFIALLFYLLHYPIAITIILPILITWRAITLRRQLYYQLNKENKYIVITFLLAFFTFLILKDYLIIAFSAIQLFLLYAGYMSSHFLIIKKEERQQVDRKLPLYILGLLAIGATLIFPLFAVGRFILKQIWEGVMYVFIFAASRIVWLFEIMDLNIGNTLPTDESYQMVEEDEVIEVDRVPLIDTAGPYLYWGMLIIFAFVILFISWRLLRKKFKEQEEDMDENTVTYKQLIGSTGREKGLFKRLYNSLFQRPSHPARRMLYQFEQKMVGTSYERHSFETVDHWSRRIGLPTNLEVYQKVRYGDLEVDREEIDQLKKELDDFKEQLSN